MLQSVNSVFYNKQYFNKYMFSVNIAMCATVYLLLTHTHTHTMD